MNEKSREKKQRRRLMLLALLCLFLAINFFRIWVSHRSRGDVLLQAQDKLRAVRSEQERLKRELAQVSSEEYIELQARNKLQYIKEGEIIVVLPTISPYAFFPPTPTPHYSNIELWIQVFFPKKVAGEGIEPSTPRL